MYYKTHVNIKRRVDLENPLVECMWFELKIKLQNILINIIYRSEKQSEMSIGIVSESTYWIESVIKIGSSNEELPVRESKWVGWIFQCEKIETPMEVV
jgi:hypothetical protein